MKDAAVEFEMRDGQDACFPSPEKLLLVEKRILESEFNAFVDSDKTGKGKIPLKPMELSQRRNSCDASGQFGTSPNRVPPMNVLPTTAITTIIRTVQASNS